LSAPDEWLHSRLHCQRLANRLHGRLHCQRLTNGCIVAFIVSAWRIGCMVAFIVSAWRISCMVAFVRNIRDRPAGYPSDPSAIRHLRDDPT